MKDAKGDSVGHATIRAEKTGVELKLSDLKNPPPGEHAIPHSPGREMRSAGFQVGRPALQSDGQAAWLAEPRRASCGRHDELHGRAERHSEGDHQE